MSTISSAKDDWFHYRRNGGSHDDCGWAYEVLLDMVISPNPVPHQGFYFDAKETTP